MLNIYNGLQKWSKTNICDLHLKNIDPFGIHEPCINIAKNQLIFEQYRMDLNWGKYDIEVRNDDAIKRNQLFFDFMQRTFNCLYGLYLREIYILIDAIIKEQLRKQSEE